MTAQKESTGDVATRFGLSRFIVWFWGVWRGWPARLVAAGLLFATFVFLLLVVLMIYVGGPWAHVVYAENPYAHLAGATLFFTAWYALVHGYKAGAAAWRRFAGRLFLLTLSMTLTFFLCELGLRRILIQRSEGNSLEGLRAMQAKKKPIYQVLQST